MASEHTPLMQQYHAIKEQYCDTLLFFQVGDFYELFFDDAKQAASFLGIALTARGKSKGKPIPLCGVPVHALDHYLKKLVSGGFKVAICDQLEPPTPGKVVKRGVTQVLTPGTLTDTQLLDEKSASYILSFFPMEEQWGVLFGELLTAQLCATVLSSQSEKTLESELARFFPDEVLLPNNSVGKSFQSSFKRFGYFTSMVDVTEDQKVSAELWIKNQFKESVQKQLEEQEAVRLALHYFYAYIRRSQESALHQFNHVQLYKPDDFLVLDAATQRNLELIKNTQNGSNKNTLFAVMDGARTPMGSRMIKKWLARPLIKKTAIEQRLDVIETCTSNASFMRTMQDYLMRIGDIERIIGRIALNRAQLHDYLSLLQALEIIPLLKNTVHTYKQLALFIVIDQHIDDFSALKTLLHTALNTDTTKEWIIAAGFNKKLDRLRALIGTSNQKILEFERTQQEHTGIQSLKVRYNQVHGYYIEITKPNAHLVPTHYIRQQTLVGRERFTTLTLQQLQTEIVQARNEIHEVEQYVFEQVKMSVLKQINSLRKLAHALAHLDALLGFADVAYNNGYVRPTFNDQYEISITQGRHPVVAQNLTNNFIPNDTQLNNEQSLWIITGPNMGGKSTYLRQVAHISIMAQCGSFVPVKEANLALLDRIFTRIGAGDNVADGKSTFLVEMEETALICTQATKNSLVILDEVGRGTSTFDGLAIAQAVVEYIVTCVQARCLFATHYHELTQLQKQHTGIVSYYAASKKTEHGIVFLYKINKGVADGSFGVEVAKLAQLPSAIINRSEGLLRTYMAKSAINIHNESNREVQTLIQEKQALSQCIEQLQKRVTNQEKVLHELQKLDFNDLSPKKAFDILWQLKDGDYI